jgi:hypothetical protein
VRNVLLVLLILMLSGGAFQVKRDTAPDSSAHAVVDLRPGRLELVAGVDGRGGVSANGRIYETIQAAIDATALNGGEIDVGPGSYQMTSALHFDNKPISLVCANPSTTILQWTSISDGIYAIYLTPGSSVRDCTIEGFGFKPRSAMQWTALTNGTAPLNNGWPNWHANTDYSPGLGVGAGATLVPTVANSNGHVYTETVPSCKAGTTEPAWPVTPHMAVQDNSCVWRETGRAGVEISGNHIHNWYYAAYPGAGGNMWQIHDNIIEGNDEGLLFIGSGHHLVRDNQIGDNYENGIDVNTGTSAIEGNDIYNNGRIKKSGTDCYDEHGLNIGSLNMSGSRVVDSMTVRGNRIYNNSNNGILIFADAATASYNHMITGNNIYDNGTDRACTNRVDGAGIAVWALREGADIRGIRISGNMVSGNRTWGVEVAVGPDSPAGYSSIDGNSGTKNGLGLVVSDSPRFLSSPAAARGLTPLQR